MNIHLILSGRHVMKGAKPETEDLGFGPCERIQMGDVNAYFELHSNGEVVAELVSRGQSTPVATVAPAISGLKTLKNEVLFFFNLTDENLHCKEADITLASLLDTVNGKANCLPIPTTGYESLSDFVKHWDKIVKAKRTGIILAIGVEENPDGTIRGTFRSIEVRIVHSEKELSVPRKFFAEREFMDFTYAICGAPEMAPDEVINRMAHICIETSLMEETSFMVDFTDGQGHYYLKHGFGEMTEKKYSEVLPYIRLVPNSISLRDDDGIIGFMSRFSCGAKFSTIIQKLRTYPMLLNVFKTYGMSGLELFRRIGVRYKYLPESFRERGALKRVIGISNSLLNKIANIKSSGYSDDLRPLIHLVDVINPQVAESIIMEYIDVIGQHNGRKVTQLSCATNLLSDIIRSYGGKSGKDYDYKHLFRYIMEEVDVYQGIESPRDALQLLRDYYYMMSSMHLKITDWFPRSLKLTHDITARNQKIFINEETQREFTQAVEDPAYQAMAYADKDWVVLVPTCAEDLITEGRNQSHCVGSYVSYVNDGKDYILFMRRANDLEKSVITLDVRPETMTLIQYRGFGNRAPTDEEMEFIKKWAKKKGLEIV